MEGITHFTRALENFVHALAESPTGWFWSGVIIALVFLELGLMLKSLECGRRRMRLILFLVLSSLGGRYQFNCHVYWGS